MSEMNLKQPDTRKNPGPLDHFIVGAGSSDGRLEAIRALEGPG